MTRQRGFGAIAAIVILVILAALAAAIVAINTSQQVSAAQDVLSARAWQAARAGNEWGLYQALKGRTWTVTPGDTCDSAPRSATLNLGAESGFHVTVSCDSWAYNEGESAPGTAQVVRVYRIKAVACPASTCPASDASVAAAGYVERSRVVLATDR